MWITQNAGVSYAHIDASLPKLWVTAVAADPKNDAIAYATFSGFRVDQALAHVFRTTDHGATWSDITGDLPDAPVNALAIDPRQSSTLYVGTDVGAFVSQNLGAAPFEISAVGAVRLASGKVVVSGGYQSALFQYDPIADSWTTLGNVYGTPAWATMYERGPGEVMIVGGVQSGGIGNSFVYTFDTLTGEPGAAGSRMFNEGSSVRLLDGRILSTGGTVLGQFGFYDPATASELYSSTTNAWTQLATPRFPEGLVVLTDGRVLALGNADGISTAIFNPTTQVWSPARPMLAERVTFATTRLLDGRVMVSGGFVGGTLESRPDVQIYDPATNRWSWSVPLPQGRNGHTATALASGAVLIAGGSGVDPARIAAIGYCFGGTLALELARDGAELAAVVAFHAGLGTANPADAQQIRGKILACIGADDPLVPAEERLAFEREMRATKVDWRLELYGNAVHGFANPNAGKLGNPAVQYHEPSHRRSWRSMLALFGETIGTP